MLKEAAFRTRFNLWQVFACPLYRMAASILGEPDSLHARSGRETIAKAMRSSLKKFTLAPKSASTELFDLLSGSRNLLAILEKAKDLSEARTKVQEGPHDFLAGEKEEEADVAAGIKREYRLSILSGRKELICT